MKKKGNRGGRERGGGREESGEKGGGGVGGERGKSGEKEENRVKKEEIEKKEEIGENKEEIGTLNRGKLEKKRKLDGKRRKVEKINERVDFSYTPEPHGVFCPNSVHTSIFELF